MSQVFAPKDLLSPSSSDGHTPCPQANEPLSPQSTTHAVFVPPFLPPPQNYRAVLANYLTQVSRHLTKDWIPHRPSPAEFESIRQDTVQRIGALRGLEASLITATRENVSKLRQEVDLARFNYQIRFFRIFRVNDLPPEILTNIFRLVSWAAHDRASGVQWRLWLTWTCKYWRTITLEDSTLWSAIWFRDPPDFERSLAWFDRAGDAPLDLRVGDSETHKFTGESMGALMDKLFTKFPTIRMFIATTTEWEPALVIIDKFRAAGAAGRSFSLERFELHRTGNPYVQPGTGFLPTEFRKPMSLLGGVPTPSLNYLSVNGVYIDWTHSVLTNLTTIDLRRMPLEMSPGIRKFRDMLSSSPALRKLCLDAAGPRFQLDEARGLPPITLAQLKILVIGDYSVLYAYYVLSHFTAHHVRDLTFLNLSGEDYSPLFALITSRFPEVRILTCYSIEVMETARSGRIMVKWLESMPSLTYLRIANLKRLFLELFLYDPKTFRHMRQRPAGPDEPRTLLCPKLSLLEVQAIDPALITEWAVARRYLGAPLRKVYVPMEWAKKITLEQYNVLRSIAPLYLIDWGRPTEEETLTNESS